MKSIVPKETKMNVLPTESQQLDDGDFYSEKLNDDAKCDKPQGISANELDFLKDPDEGEK